MKLKAFLVGGAVVAVGMLLRGPLEIGSSPKRDEGKRIRVEVLNGSGVNRAGQGLAERLRERGFDVVDIRNADRSDYPETLVLDRVGVPEFARSVAEELKVQTPVQQRNGDLLLEVTVILGGDLAEQYRGGSH